MGNQENYIIAMCVLWILIIIIVELGHVIMIKIMIKLIIEVGKKDIFYINGHVLTAFYHF